MSNWLNAAPLLDAEQWTPVHRNASRCRCNRNATCQCGVKTRGDLALESEDGLLISDTAWVTIKIAAGERDANKLANSVFWRRHPELAGQKIRSDQRDLANEWLAILRDVVRPTLARLGGGATAPSGGDVAAAFKMAARAVPGLGITLRALLERHRSRQAPDMPIEVLLAFVYKEAGHKTFADATSGKLNPKNQQYSPSFFELGVFQTPAGAHGCRPIGGKKVCAYSPPGHDVARSQFGKGWMQVAGRLPDASNWQDPDMQVRVGLWDLTTVGERIRKEFPDLFPTKGLWYVRMAVLYSFSRGADWTRAFLKKYRGELARLPEAQRWTFLKGKQATRSNGATDIFRPENVDAKMELAARLRAASSGGATSPPQQSPQPHTTTVGPAPAPVAAPTPAPGTVETRRSFPTNPPITNSPGRRSVQSYDAVLDQFGVSKNPRYAHRNGATFCNIFAWDVTRAMGAEIPHWIKPNGDPTLHTDKSGNELNANAVNLWLHQHGSRFGWRRVELGDAVSRANAGYPTAASHRNKGGIGHIAMIRPGEASATEGPWMAQAGATNSNRIRLYRVWKRSTPVEFWTHD